MNKTIVQPSDQMLEYLLNGNREKSSAMAKQYLSESSSIKDLYEKVFKEALYKVGKLWENNKITVATEHMATAIVEGVLNEFYNEFEIKENQTKKVVLACVENELHQVGIKMVADVFEINGWESFFIGTGIPLAELIEFLKQEKPEVLAISLSIYFNFRNLTKMIEAVVDEFPAMKILIGGQAFEHINNESLENFDQLKLIPNLYELETYLETL